MDPRGTSDGSKHENKLGGGTEERGQICTLSRASHLDQTLSDPPAEGQRPLRPSGEGQQLLSEGTGARTGTRLALVSARGRQYGKMMEALRLLYSKIPRGPVQSPTQIQLSCTRAVIKTALLL